MNVILRRTKMSINIYSEHNMHIGTLGLTYYTRKRKEIIDKAFPVGEVIICTIEDYVKFIERMSRLKYIETFPIDIDEEARQMRSVLHEVNEHEPTRP